MDFCPKHHCDTYVCQVCGRICCEMCDGKRSVWGETGRGIKGNICPNCQKPVAPPISLFEHCKKESGLTSVSDINRYMNRHYGHG